MQRRRAEEGRTLLASGIAGAVLVRCAAGRHVFLFFGLYGDGVCARLFLGRQGASEVAS
jgi:hypothetical protein